MNLVRHIIKKILFIYLLYNVIKSRKLKLKGKKDSKAFHSNSNPKKKHVTKYKDIVMYL